MAKICLRIFIETLVEDLPGSSQTKQEFRGVLLHFSSYAVFAKTFGTGGGGASAPAVESLPRLDLTLPLSGKHKCAVETWQAGRQAGRQPGRVAAACLDAAG